MLYYIMFYYFVITILIIFGILGFFKITSIWARFIVEKDLPTFVFFLPIILIYLVSFTLLLSEADPFNLIQER